MVFPKSSAYGKVKFASYSEIQTMISNGATSIPNDWSLGGSGGGGTGGDGGGGQEIPQAPDDNGHWGILQPVVDWINSKFSGLLSVLAAPFLGLANAIGAIGDVAVNIWNSIKEIPSIFLDGIYNFCVPSKDFFKGFHDDIDYAFKNHIPIIAQIFELIENILGSFENISSQRPPDFIITVYGAICKIWDWSTFDTYRSYIHGIILVCAYIKFSIKMYHSLAGFIGRVPSHSLGYERYYDFDRTTITESFVLNTKTGEWKPNGTRMNHTKSV